ncbi:Ketohexokinase [hydrothermal vent metagenome]|uniref:Ketohexokinase n=1 Tax=hydrothermal vent metagenome TaxID=652676 RepID=A0A3B0ZRX9_9ZZZZ
MAQIIGVGIATLDIINSVDGYPAEDAEVRALSQRICRGGNATNTLVVLSQLGHHCQWAGVLSDEPDGQRIIDDLKQYQIDATLCRVVKGGKVPTSYITLNQKNGSRTIIHHRDLPEFSFDHFSQINLSSCDWLHFEGRNIRETEKMLAHIAANSPDLPCSLEIEKVRPGIRALFKYVGALLFSKNYVLEHEDSDGVDGTVNFLQTLHREFPDKQIICTWGEDGAYGIDHHGIVYHAPPSPPANVIDTLAAGDTFNAAVIDSLIKGQSTEEAIKNGCRIAGQKCGHVGLGFISQS